MQTFEDFLVWYNNLDVVPFIEAVEKMSQFWRERKIDMFKDGITVPGLTIKYLLSYLSPHTYLSLFARANSDLYHLIKDNNTGGPSIILHEYHDSGETGTAEIRFVTSQHLVSGIWVRSIASLSFAASLRCVYKTWRSGYRGIKRADFAFLRLASFNRS